MTTDHTQKSYTPCSVSSLESLGPNNTAFGFGQFVITRMILPVNNTHGIYTVHECQQQTSPTDESVG